MRLYMHMELIRGSGQTEAEEIRDKLLSSSSGDVGTGEHVELKEGEESSFSICNYPSTLVIVITMFKITGDWGSLLLIIFMAESLLKI